MLIPRYWAKADSDCKTPDGQLLRLRAWGCSPASVEDAQADADRRLADYVDRLRGGQFPGRLYPYGCRAIREEVLHEIPGADSQPNAIVTRNGYGSLVLNAASTLFLDIDLPADNLARRLMNLWRGSRQSLADEILAALRQRLASIAEAGFRIYRTAAGFRVMGISHTYNPVAAATQELMAAAGTDRTFVQLCRAQSCFRARLTPKPWRIGIETPKFRFPVETSDDAAARDAWCQRYEAASAGWATCQFVGQLGPELVHPDVQLILELHDFASRATTQLPLA